MNAKNGLLLIVCGINNETVGEIIKKIKHILFFSIT